MKNQFKLGDLFGEYNYDEAYEFVIKNGYTIEEVQGTEYEDGEVSRLFQIVEIPKPTAEEILNDLRNRREIECFPTINRGVLWHNTLTEEQRIELDKWYKEWLDVTDKYVENIDVASIIPKKPEWLK